jgi:hypothetical protein
MSLVDYGARGVPNLFLTAPLDPTYDALSKEFIAERPPRRPLGPAGDLAVP